MSCKSEKPSNSQKPVVLLTGFGPFPGVPVNASAELVRALARTARRKFTSHRIAVRILKTEWRAAPTDVARLLELMQPALALHFGVATGSATVRLETCAHNACRVAPDAAGLPPLAPLLVADGDSVLPVSIAVQSLAERLARLQIPVSVSHDAGGYLCNAVLYQALNHTAASGRPTRIGFIHVPDTLKSPPVTLSLALRAGLEIIDACLAETGIKNGDTQG